MRTLFDSVCVYAVVFACCFLITSSTNPAFAMQDETQEKDSKGSNSDAGEKKPDTDEKEPDEKKSRSKKKRSPVPGTSVGEKIKEISGEDVEGEEFSLSDYEGKVIMLDFWGDW